MLRVLTVALCVVALGVGSIAGPALWTRWMARDRVLTLAQAPARDVAIIYGAEVYPSGRPSPYLRARLDLGAALYKAGKAKALIVSGDDAASHNREATSMKKYLVSVGVPAAKVVEDAYGLDTYDTCVRARDVFGVTSALLVSQRYHLHRAVATCRAVGVDAVGVGDVSVKKTSKRWDEFARRELGANLKMVWDLVTSRAPVQEPPSDAVKRALAA
ncbi:SanA/YdcF family protein [Propioniciclava coleopterorum]|uniref:SanA/YdcF family protein n=1 Tax=Propioniciclava coleopterorum TaxID=2714937 RepID=UPI001FE716E8|nr:ElyC/SanA/YdcF family protein [Propioniciclava coleopterorum]